MSTRLAWIRWNLRIEPPTFERDFWRSTQTLRALQLTDTIASISGLVHVVSAVRRYVQMQSSSAAAHINSAPFLCVYAVNILTQTAIAAVLLLLMTFKPATYKAHRFELVAADRLLLDIYTMIVLCSGTAATAIAAALAARTTSEQPRPLIALLLNITHPGVYILHQAMFFVPFRWALLLQSVNFGASLFWSARLPCVSSQPADGTTAVCSASLDAAAETAACPIVQHPAADISGAAQVNPTGQFFPAAQAQATDTCLMLNYMVEYLNSLFGNMPMSGIKAAAPPVYCQGVYAVQTLQVFVSMLMFLVVPLSMIFWWEYTWKRCYLESINADNSMQIDSFWSRISERLSRAGADPAAIETDADDHTAVTYEPPRQPGSVFYVVCLCIAVSVLTVYAAWSLCIVIVSILHRTECTRMLQ